MLMDKSTGSAKCLTGLLGYNDLHAIVMHSLNWERRFIERRTSIHPQLTTSSVFAQVSFVAIPAARQMRRSALPDHMILAYEIMK